MTVSVAVLREVRAQMDVGEYSTAAIDRFIREKEVLEDPNADLAQVLRDAYYNDGLTRCLNGSQDPVQWVRMAAAAREFLQASREPRVFLRGDQIPEDVRYAKTADGSGVVRCPDGSWDYANLSDADSVAAVAQSGSGGWGYFFIHEYPVTEVLELPAPAEAEPATDSGPRVFHRGDYLPLDVIAVRNAQGKIAVRTATKGEWLYKYDDGGYDFASIRASRYGWDYFDSSEYPLTEVPVDDFEEPASTPREWGSLVDVPQGIEVVDSDGDHWKRIDNEWHFDSGGNGDWEDAAQDSPTEDDLYGPFTEVLA